MSDLPIALVSDHAGFALKTSLKEALVERGLPVLDLGPDRPDPVDYPDMADRLAAAMKAGQAERGVVICGTGIGISIAVNRHPGIRAALCHDVSSARLAREHNNANVLALGARLIGQSVAQDCLITFLDTAFAGGRHADRVAKLDRAGA